MSKKEFVTTVVLVSFFVLLLNFAVTVHFSDDIAKVLGHLLTLVLLPFVIGVIPTSVFLLATRVKLSNKQATWLYVWPCIFTAAILLYFALMLNYGGPL